MQNINFNKDKTIFIYLLFFIIFIIFLSILTMLFFISNSGLAIYKLIIKLIVILTVLVCLYLVFVASFVILILRNKKLPLTLLCFVDRSLKIVYPFMILIAEVFKVEKDRIRRVFSQINNRIVILKGKTIKNEDILILIPHCLQKSFCKHKITGNILNCKNCGHCDIGDLIKIREKYSVSIEVVTGGTLARKLIKDYKPKGIIAVACERDLSSGILDIKSIPVIGITNKRPEGPCYNTCIDINEVEEAIQLFIGR